MHDTLPLVIAHTVLRIDPRRASHPNTLDAKAGYAYACLPNGAAQPGLLTVGLLNIILDTYADVRHGRPAGLTPPSTTLLRARALRVRGNFEPRE